MKVFNEKRFGYQASKKNVQDRCEWGRFVRGNVWGTVWGDEQLTLTMPQLYLPQIYEGLEGWKSVCGQAYNLKCIKGKISVFLPLIKLCFSFTVAYFMA